MLKRKRGGGKGVLNNVKKTARLVKRGIPYYHQTIKIMDRFQNIAFWIVSKKGGNFLRSSYSTRDFLIRVCWHHSSESHAVSTRQKYASQFWPKIWSLLILGNFFWSFHSSIFHVILERAFDFTKSFQKSAVFLNIVQMGGGSNPCSKIML